MHVLILGARAPACLEWARAFRAAGWEVSAADSLAWPLARSSVAVDHYIRLPEPRGDPTGWVDSIARFADRQAVDLIIPTCEEAFYLSNGLPELVSHCRVFVAGMPAMHRLHHKFRFSELAADLPVNAPETVLLESSESIDAISGESQDWVFKPAYSRFGNCTLIRPRPELLNRVRPSVDYPWVAQRFVPGREYCSYSLMEQGRLTAHNCYNPSHRVGSGAGIYFEPVDAPPVREFVEQFGVHTNYTGQVGFDFIASPDGKFHVLECNPRATSGIHLFSDEPLALVAAAQGQRQGEVLLSDSAPRMVAFAMLLFAAPPKMFSGKFWRDYSRARDVVTIPGDRRPLAGQLLSLLEIAGRAVTRRRGLLAASTVDIEWDGQPLDNTVQ